MFLLKFFPLPLLITLTHSMDIECDYHEEELLNFGNRYICDVEVKHYGFSRSVKSVTGVHLPGKNNSDVEIVSFGHQKQITNIPENLNKFFPNLIGLEIENGSISSLFGHELRKYPKLKLLRLDNNYIESIPSGFFDGNPELEAVSFQSNRIVKIGQELFRGLFNLSFMNFNFNQCISTTSNRHQNVTSVLKILRKNCEPAKGEEEPEGVQEILRGMRRDNERVLWNIERISKENSDLKDDLRRLTDIFRSFRSGNCDCRSGLRDELRTDGDNGEEVTEKVPEEKKLLDLDKAMENLKNL